MALTKVDNEELKRLKQAYNDLANKTVEDCTRFHARAELEKSKRIKVEKELNELKKEFNELQKKAIEIYREGVWLRVREHEARIGLPKSLWTLPQDPPVVMAEVPRSDEENDE